MRAIALILTLLLSVLAAADKATCHLRYVRPTKVMSAIRGEHPRWYRSPSKPGFELVGGDSFRPAITKIETDDRAGTITLEGSKDAIDEFQRIIAEFDIPTQSKKVLAHIEIHSALDRYDTKADVEITNNQSVRFGDELTGIEMEIRPRINGDDATTALIDLSHETLRSYFVVRVDKGGFVELGVEDNGVTWGGKASLIPVDRPITRQPARAKATSDLRVTIRFRRS